MQFKKLIVNNILEEAEFIFDFQSKKKAHRKKDIELLKKALPYVFFGDAALSRGRLEFTFDDQGDAILVRDFKENTAYLQTATQKYEGETAVNDYFYGLLGMNKKEWEAFFFVDEGDLYNSIFERTGDYFLSFLSKLSIGESDVQQAQTRYKEKLASYKNRDAMLADLATEFNPGEINSIVSQLKAEADKLYDAWQSEKEFLAAEEKAHAAHKELQELLREQTELIGQEQGIATLRSRLDHSEKIKSMLVSLRKSAAIIAENDGLETAITEKKKALAAKLTDAAAGERVLNKKQAAFSKLTATIEGLYTALSELIYDNVSSGKSDGKIMDAVDKHFLELTERLNELKQKENDLTAELEETSKAITVYTKKYDDTFLTESFSSVIAYNEEQARRAEEKKSRLVSDDRLPDQALLDNYRALEKKREELQRSYILADSILKETDAIDAKINENNAAIKSQQENLDALENAKETLMQYMEKCRKKVDAADADIFALSTRKEYYTEIEKLEYGQHCPVCNMPVIDKRDISAAVAQTEARLKKQKDDIASYRDVMTEYSAKLEEINLRIGSLRAKINTGKGYVDSLLQSKMNKIAFLKKIYTEAGVQDRDQLIELLEKTVNDLAKAFVAVSELRSLDTVSFITGENIRKVNACMEEISGQNNNGPIAQCRNALTALEQEEGLTPGALSGAGAVDGDLYETLKSLIEKKKSLLAEIAEVRKQIEIDQSRDAIVTADGKSYTYGQLCIVYAGKQYISVIDEIRKKEAEKQELVNEIAAMTGVLKEKKKSIETDSNEIKALESRFQTNLNYLETIQGDERYDPSLLKNKTIEQVESEVLSEGERAECARKIDEYAARLTFIDVSIQSLKESANVTTSSTELQIRKSDLSMLEKAYKDKKAELEEASGALAISDIIVRKRSALVTEAQLYRENYSFVNNVYEDNAFIIKETVNYALAAMFPSYHVENDRGGLCLKRGERIVTAVDDDVYSALLVALTDALRYIVSGILDRPKALRMLTLKADPIPEGLRSLINDYALAHNLVILYR